MITSDPILPWVRVEATLYSLEYLSLVKDHLTPGGVVTQWIPSRCRRPRGTRGYGAGELPVAALAKPVAKPVVAKGRAGVCSNEIDTRAAMAVSSLSPLAGRGSG